MVVRAGTGRPQGPVPAEISVSGRPPRGSRSAGGDVERLGQIRDDLSQRCPDCGLVEARGSYCSACLRPTAGASGTRTPDRPLTAAVGHPRESAAHQRCTRCGTEERRGSYCSCCQWREYELLDHAHPAGQPCPLGPYLNPSGRPSPGERRRFEAERTVWEASPDAHEVVQHIVHRRTHPARDRATASEAVG
jgi:hypothetical protein